MNEKPKTRAEQLLGETLGTARVGGARLIEHGRPQQTVSNRARRRARKVKSQKLKATPIANARAALKTFQANALVRHPGPQLKADQALRDLTPALTADELSMLRSARGCVLDNAGHHASEFNDACTKVRLRFDRDEGRL